MCRRTAKRSFNGYCNYANVVLHRASGTFVNPLTLHWPHHAVRLPGYHCQIVTWLGLTKGNLNGKKGVNVYLGLRLAKNSYLIWFKLPVDDNWIEGRKIKNKHARELKGLRALLEYINTVDSLKNTYGDCSACEKGTQNGRGHIRFINGQIKASTTTKLVGFCKSFNPKRKRKQILCQNNNNVANWYWYQKRKSTRENHFSFELACRALSLPQHPPGTQPQRDSRQIIFSMVIIYIRLTCPSARVGVQADGRGNVKPPQRSNRGIIKIINLIVEQLATVVETFVWIMAKWRDSTCHFTIWVLWPKLWRILWEMESYFPVFNIVNSTLASEGAADSNALNMFWGKAKTKI